MNIKDMNCFIRVSEKNSISAAAESLFMTPQGVSKAIKRMEEELGAQLFIRTQNGVILTDYGRIFRECAERITVDYESTFQEISALRAQNSGFIRMVSAFGILRLLSPDFVHAFEDTFPKLHLDYMEFPDVYVPEQVLSEKYDIGLIPYLKVKENPDFVYTPLFSREIFFISHEGSRFSDREEVSVTEISREPLIMENEHFLIHHILEDICRREGTDLDVYFNTSGFSLCYKLCKEGEGNTVSMDFIFDDMDDGTLRKIPFREHPMWEIALIRRKDTPVSDNLEKFISFTREWCETI